VRRVRALLIFDEVVTGFRWHGGAQGYFGVRPDLTISASASLAAIQCGRRRRAGEVIMRFAAGIGGTARGLNRGRSRPTRSPAPRGTMPA